MLQGAPNEFGSRILGQPRRFIELIADAANTTPENIVDMDLFLYDTNQAVNIFFLFKWLVILSVVIVGDVGKYDNVYH